MNLDPLLELEAEVSTRADGQSPLRRKSLSTRLSLAAAEEAEEEAEAEAADREQGDVGGGGGGDKAHEDDGNGADPEEPKARKQPKRPLKRASIGGPVVLDVISETVAESVHVVDIELLKESARPMNAPDGLDLDHSEKKQKTSVKRRRKE